MRCESFIAIADIHIGKNLYNIPELGEDLKTCFKSVIELAVKKKVNAVVIVGDLYESNKPTPDLVTFIREQAIYLGKHDIKLVGIAGDHDKPINTESWAKVGDVEQVDVFENLAGSDYDDDPEKVIANISARKNRNKVEWLFAHAQVPTLFKFCQDKKKLDFSVIPIFDLYPNLKGVILGDIHKPFEGTLIEKTKEAYIGYCGSLGITKSDEINTKTGVIYVDGDKVTRIPFKMPRDFVVLDLTKTANTVDISFYLDKYRSSGGLKPVFVAEHTRDTADNLKLLKPLNEIGFVQAALRPSYDKPETEGHINIRSEISNTERISAVLDHCTPDKELSNLLFSLLTSTDPKLLLDSFKSASL